MPVDEGTATFAPPRMERRIIIKHVMGRADLHSFIRLPVELPDRRPNQLPPIWSDEYKFHDPDRNTALKNCGYMRWLAYDGDRVLGRVMGIIHHPYNKRHGERTARFFQLDAANDQPVVDALVLEVERWARAQGMTDLVGPFGLSDKDPQGVQVEGFEHMPVLATPTNAAHIPVLLEAAGMRPMLDLMSYRLDIPEHIPDTYRKIAQRALRNGELRLVHFSDRRSLRPWIVPVLRLVNEAYEGLYGFVPMSEAEMHQLAETYLPVIDPRFVFIIADKSDLPAAFVVAIPDMSEGIRRAGGRLFPFGFLHILWSMWRTRQLDLFLGGVRPDLQGRGLTTVLGLELFTAAKRRGLTFIDSHLVLETNTRMRAELERLGAQVYKRYRIYQKNLA